MRVLPPTERLKRIAFWSAADLMLVMAASAVAMPRRGIVRVWSASRCSSLGSSASAIKRERAVVSGLERRLSNSADVRGSQRTPVRRTVNRKARGRQDLSGSLRRGIGSDICSRQG